MNHVNIFANFPLIALSLLSLLAAGCGVDPVVTDTVASDTVASDSSIASDIAAEQSDLAQEQPPESFRLNQQTLLQARLPLEQTNQGWVRLFDGQTFFGWQMAGKAKWSIKDGALVSDEGERGLICTSTRWKDYELTLEYQATADTNGGVFLRTPLFPQNPETDCYELNIAPANNPFPTGSLVKRKRVELDESPAIDPQQWHRFDIRVQGGQITVKQDGQLVLEYSDPNPLPTNLIGLQHNSGAVAYRDIRIKPLGLESLLSETVEENWVRYPKMDGDFQVTQDGLHITGGRGQLESKQSFGDFVMLTEIRTNAAALNSGIFFRCIPGDQMMGYECQISNATNEGDPLSPVDCGTGGFFRRQDARIVASDDLQWFSMLLVADGPTMAAWVNGLQVSEWVDRREPNENPRKGQRLQAGTLMLQAHDPTTNLHLKELSVSSL